MKVLFWGTPAFAVPTLRALAEEAHDVVAVVTQPDRPVGRGRRTTPSEVRVAAESEGWPVLTPERPRGDAFLERIAALEPDVSVVVAYGHILVRDVLDVPVHGSINVHASLLPELRGAAPIHWAIARGHERTGVTVMRMVEAMDAGPILLQVEEPIGARQTTAELSLRLAEVGASALVETLALLSLDQLEPQEQDHARATYAPKVDRSSARIDWAASAVHVANLVRAMDDAPGAWSTLGGTPHKLFGPRPDEGDAARPPGTILAGDGTSGLRVACGRGTVTFDEIQPPGKRRMPAPDWLRGHGAAATGAFE